MNEVELESFLQLKNLDINLSQDDSKQDLTSRYTGEYSKENLFRSIDILRGEIQESVFDPETSTCGTYLHNIVVKGFRNPELTKDEKEEWIVKYGDIMPDKYYNTSCGSKYFRIHFNLQNEDNDNIHGIVDQNAGDLLKFTEQVLDFSYEYLLRYFDYPKIQKGYRKSDINDPIEVNIFNFGGSASFGAAFETGPILFNSWNWNLQEYDKLRASIIHELYHKFQYTFGVKTRKQDLWILEGMASWMEISFAKTFTSDANHEWFDKSFVFYERSYWISSFWHFATNKLGYSFPRRFLNNFHETNSNGLQALRCTVDNYASNSKIDSVQDLVAAYSLALRHPFNELDNPFNYYSRYFHFPDPMKPYLLFFNQSKAQIEISDQTKGCCTSIEVKPLQTNYMLFNYSGLRKHAFSLEFITEDPRGVNISLIWESHSNEFFLGKIAPQREELEPSMVVSTKLARVLAKDERNSQQVVSVITGKDIDSPIVLEIHVIRIEST